MKTPYPTLKAQPSASTIYRSVWVLPPLGAARKAARRTVTRTMASTTSSSSHDTYRGSGRRQATTPEIMSVLMTPPAKMGSVPNRLAISAARMSAGVSGPEWVSQRVRRHLGELNFSPVSTRSRPNRHL
ncbi:hypothetical protein D3C71_1095700 [compost metagenome]